MFKFVIAAGSGYPRTRGEFGYASTPEAARRIIARTYGCPESMVTVTPAYPKGCEAS